MAGFSEIVGSDTHPSLAGRLLVSPPWMDDPHFGRSVVLLLAHSPDGAFGIVLNDESTTNISAVQDLIGPAWCAVITPPESLFVGGPCSTSSLIAVGSVAAPESSLPNVAVVDLNADAPIEGIGRVRLFAGYAGWSALQLEDELERGGWFVADANPEDVFTSQPDSLWERVLERNGEPYARMPIDPRLN